MQQLQHQNTNLLKHRKQIVIACNFIESPANLGMICRNAEAFGAQQILLSDANVSFLESTRFKKTVRNSDKNMSFKAINSLSVEVDNFTKKGFHIVALELTTQSISIQKMKQAEKILIILGHENYGIPEEILPLCNQAIHIDQFGKNSSINVAQALGISLYEITRLA